MLATRLAVFIFLINTVMLTALGVYYARRFSAHIEQSLVTGSSLPALLMKQNRENYKLIRDPAVLLRLVGRPVEQALLISPDGQILNSLDPDLEGLSLPQLSSHNPLFSQLTQTDYSVSVLRPVLRSKTRRCVVDPIETSDALVGYLWLCVNVEGDTLAKQQIAVFFFLGSLIAIVFCGFSQFILVHHLVIPRVRRMAQCVRRVEKGELDVRIAGSRMYDELGGLEISINQMVAELESRALLQKGLMSDLESAKEVSEIANRCKNEFLANISHELRTPMNAVIGLSELLLDTGLNQRQKEYVETVLQSGEWLLSIVNNILALVKLESDRQRVDLSPVSVRELFDELSAHYRPFAEGCGLDFTTLIDEGVPDRIVTSPDILQQVLGNLLLNGFKFTPEGYVRLHAGLIRLENEGVSAVLEFSVQDSGIGISHDSQDKIYDAFTQVDGSIARKYGGVGLGLTISKQLIALLGGDLLLTSEIGEGSSFAFSIEVEVLCDTSLDENPQKAKIEHENMVFPEPELEPVTPADGGALSPEEEEEADELKPPVRAAPQVLVVEDNKVNRMMLKMSLKRAGCQVTEAENGLRALEVLGLDGDKTGPVNFDLILMDIQMPEMDGIEATRQIREKQKGGSLVPIVAVTAHMMEGDCELFIRSEMDDYLPKPVKADSLMVILKKFLGDSLPSPE